MPARLGPNDLGYGLLIFPVPGIRNIDRNFSKGIREISFNELLILGLKPRGDSVFNHGLKAVIAGKFRI